MRRNEAEVSIIFNVTVTLHTSIHGNTRTLFISFAVANIKDSIVGNLFLKTCVKSLNNEQMSLTFNTQHESHVTTLLFTDHKEKVFPFSSCIYTIKVKIRFYFKPNASESLSFPN